MDVTSLCSRLVAITILLVAQFKRRFFAQSAGEARPHITPDRLQFFEYETVYISCEKLMGLTGWTVMHKTNKPTVPDICTPPASSCIIQPAFERHSGEFWCEDEEGNATGSINISVTAGSVILDFPARPVKEGSDVTLYCRKKSQTLTHIADFYKDGVRLKTKYDNNNMNIRNVSKSHEGLYKCSISGSGSSPESRLTVLEKENKSGGTKGNPDKGTKDNPDRLILLLISVGISIAVLLLLVIGLYRHQNREAFLCLLSRKSMPASHSPEDHTVSRENTDAVQHATAAVNKPQNEVSGVGDADDVTYADVELHSRSNEPSKSSRGKQNKLLEEDVVYSFITFGPSDQN